MCKDKGLFDSNKIYFLNIHADIYISDKIKVYLPKLIKINKT